MKRVLSLVLALLLFCVGYVSAAEEPEVPREPIAPSPELINRAIDVYGTYGAAQNRRVEEILDGLESLYPDYGARWRGIFDCWRRLDTETVPDSLPGNLPDTDALCIVVLGFQLEPNGGMQQELYQRLEVALRCAEQYPNAYVLCTGGHTASSHKNASEAGRMTDWLFQHGVAPWRLIREDRSLTTTQNAEFSYAILKEQYPSVTALAVVSSNYHVASGAVLLEAMSVLSAPSAEEAPFHVLACAACTVRAGVSRSYATHGLKTIERFVRYGY